MKVKIIFFLFLFGSFTHVKSQLVNEILNADYRINTDILTSKLNYLGHTAMKPLLFNDVNFLDSTNEKSLKLHYSNFNSEKSFKIFASPLLGSSFTQDLAIDSNYFLMGIGAKIDMNIKNKLFDAWKLVTDYFIIRKILKQDNLRIDEYILIVGEAHRVNIEMLFKELNTLVQQIGNTQFGEKTKCVKLYETFKFS